MFAPLIPDKAGRGALCAQIDQLAKEWLKLVEQGDVEASRMVLRRLDSAKAEFWRLYDKKERGDG